MKPVSIFDITPESASGVFFSATQGLKAQLDAGVSRTKAVQTAEPIIRADNFFAPQAAQDPGLDSERTAALESVVPEFESRFATFEEGEAADRPHPLSWGQMKLDILGT